MCFIATTNSEPLHIDLILVHLRAKPITFLHTLFVCTIQPTLRLNYPTQVCKVLNVLNEVYHFGYAASMGWLAYEDGSIRLVHTNN